MKISLHRHEAEFLRELFRQERENMLRVMPAPLRRCHRRAKAIGRFRVLDKIQRKLG